MTVPDGPPHDPRLLVETLDRHGVQYLQVGGAAAYAYGAARLTEDADVVVRREHENLGRLAAAMRDLHARLRVDRMSDEEAKLLPVRIDAHTLTQAGVSTWMTDAGGFDVLAGLEAADGRLIPYEDLVERATVLSGDGFVVRAAALEGIITAKERANREKDHDALGALAPKSRRQDLKTLRDTMVEWAIDEPQWLASVDGAAWLPTFAATRRRRGQWAESEGVLSPVAWVCG